MKTKLIIVGCVLLFIATPLIIWGVRLATADVRGQADMYLNVQSAEFRQAAYDHFFEACSSIEGLEGSIAEQQVALTTITDERTKGIATQALTGTQAARRQAIADYNADARKNHTEGQFRDNDLPYRITMEGTTSCGSE